MATRAASGKGQADWRAAFRRSMRRAAQISGAGILFALMVFLALSIISYSQTDPSPSTAASSNGISNWMGASGAWAAEQVLFLFGATSVLLLPLLYVTARKLWRGIEADEGGEEDTTRWWLPFGLLIIAMVLLSTMLSLAVDAPRGTS